MATGKEDSEEVDDTIDVEDDPVPQPTFAQMIAAADTIRRYSLYTKNKDYDFLKVSDQVEAAVRREKEQRKSQKTIADFFATI